MASLLGRFSLFSIAPLDASNDKKFKFSDIDLALEENLHRMLGEVVAMGDYAWAPSEKEFAGRAVHVDAEQTAYNEGPNTNRNEVRSTS